MKLINFDAQVPSVVAEWETIAEWMDVLDTVDEDTVWSIARESEDIPHFGNIYMNQLANAIGSECEDKYGVEVTYYINDQDSHLYIDGDEIRSLDDFTTAVGNHILNDLRGRGDDTRLSESLTINGESFEEDTPIEEVKEWLESHFGITL